MELNVYCNYTSGIETVPYSTCVVTLNSLHLSLYSTLKALIKIILNYNAVTIVFTVLLHRYNTHGIIHFIKAQSIIGLRFTPGCKTQDAWQVVGKINMTPRWGSGASPVSIFHL